MTILQTVSTSISPETPINENYETLECSAVYGKRHPATTGLIWGYYGGRWSGFAITQSTITLSASATNYMVVNRTTGALSNSSASTNWDNTTDYARVYKITTSTTAVTGVEDHRQGLYGVLGYPASSSSSGGGAGGAVKLYPDTSDVLADSANTVGIDTLALSASESTPTTISATVNANTLQIGPAYEDGEIGGTTISGGEWTADLYRYVDATGGTTKILTSVYVKAAQAGTVAITGSGTSRTATVTGGTPFVAGDVNADASKSAWVYTPAGQFRITAYTSSTIVTVETKTGYSNETGVAYSKDAYYTQADTGDINETSATAQIIEFFANDLACNTTDKIVIRFWATTDAASNRTVYIKFGGTSQYSHIHTPLRTRHNDLAGLDLGDYRHLTAAQKTAVAAPSRGAGSSVAGEPTASQVIYNHIVPFAFTIPAGFANCFSKSVVSATAQADFAIKKNNSTTIGTMRYAAAATSATFIDVAMPASFAAGDLLTIVAPASPDATLADIATTIVGVGTL